MIRRKEGLNKENEYSYALFKKYFDAISTVTDASSSIIKENAKRRVESSQEMRRLAKENSPSDAPKKANVPNGGPALASSPSATESLARASSSSSSSVANPSEEIELKLFLHEMAQGREKCELIYGHKKETDLSQPKCLGVEASKTMPGFYSRTLGTTVTRGPDGWSQFVITYDNKFILNYTDHEREEAKAAGKPKSDFNHQTMGCGTFLKAAGKLKITGEGKIVISPYSDYLELGWDYTPIILFVLREKGLSIPNGNILIADEQGYIICHPEVSQTNKLRKPEKIVPFYLNEKRFPLAKAIAENKELDVKSILSKLFLSIDDSIFFARNKNKKDISELITKKNHLKKAIVNLLLGLTRNDLFKMTEPTIDEVLSEINKNIELIKNKFDPSIKEVLERTIYHHLCEINKNIIELMKTKDDAHLKNTVDEKSTEKAINETLSDIKRNIESINTGQSKKECQMGGGFYKKLCETNEFILSAKNTDNVTVKEFRGKAVRQYFDEVFDEVNEDIQSIKETQGVALNFVNNELGIWLHHIFNLKFQNENKLGAVERKGESVLSKELSNIENNLEEINKADSFPEGHINEHDLIRFPFARFYSENPTKTCIALLRDYTKGGFVWRLLTGAWWRHHISAVNKFLKEYDNQHYPESLSIQAIYRELFNLNEGTLANYPGKQATLFARLLFCEQLENRSFIVNEAPSQREALNDRGLSPVSSSPFTASVPMAIKQPERQRKRAVSFDPSPAFYKEIQDSLSPLPVSAPTVEEELTPPLATSSLMPGR